MSIEEQFRNKNRLSLWLCVEEKETVRLDVRRYKLNCKNIYDVLHKQISVWRLNISTKRKLCIFCLNLKSNVWKIRVQILCVQESLVRFHCICNNKPFYHLYKHRTRVSLSRKTVLRYADLIGEVPLLLTVRLWLIFCIDAFCRKCQGLSFLSYYKFV